VPEYTFRNIKTGKTRTYQIKMSEYDDFKINHPNLERLIDATMHFNRSSRGFDSLSQKAAKKDAGWGEVLSKIGEQNPHSPLAQEFHRNKSINRIKAENIVEKHAIRQAKARAKRK
jgi:hypothetical protein